MRIAFLGCGYVSNMYRLTMEKYPQLELNGVFDLERSRAETMARLTNSKVYASFNELLNDDVELVLNLTNPTEHYETTKALLNSGKHVFSEKPIALNLSKAQELVALAERKSLLLSSAPCTLHNPVAQTLWHALNNNVVGNVRLVYAAMDDGMVNRAPTAKWINEAGVAWPTIDEFETGCTIEHAGYVLTWLCAMFGPAEQLTAFSDIIQPDKISGIAIKPAPDFSVATIKFRSGVIARMTNGIYAEHDHQLQLFGDDGVLSIEDPRNDRAKIKLRRYHTIRRKRFLSPLAKHLPLLGGSEKIASYRGSQTRDFCRSIVDMVEAIETERSPYMTAAFALHVTELTLACHFATHPTGKESDYIKMPYFPVTDFKPMQPLSQVI
jgi:predicted dehydrogenase